jgi:polysaccharide pyruvyl transferase WcaK-like protein
MQFLFLSDTSGRTPHIGDEGMLEANLQIFRRLFPGCKTAVAAGPDFDTARLQSEFVPRLDFTGLSAMERDELLERLTRVPNPSIAAVQSALSCDVLVISGGGNLSSSWPHHIYERVAMARLAASRGTPVVVLGQTLGPQLDSRERALVTELLELSLWTGLRESYSYALALELGAASDTLSYQLDDAAFLTPAPVPEILKKLTVVEGRPYVAVTAHPLGDLSVFNPVVKAFASTLRDLVHATGANLIFLPHASFPGQPHITGDEAYGEVINRALYGNPPMSIAPVLTAPETAWLTQQASLVLSTRYHPLVFALSASVPCLAFWDDEYTRRKLQGALIHAHRPHDALPIRTMLHGGALPKALELWQHRTSIKNDLLRRVTRWREKEQARENELRQRLLARLQSRTIASPGTGRVI